MDLFDILDFILDPILELFVHKMPKEVWLKQFLPNVLGTVCMGAAIFGWLLEIWLLIIPGAAGMIWFLWRAHRVYMEWISERR